MEGTQNNTLLYRREIAGLSDLATEYTAIRISGYQLPPFDLIPGYPNVDQPIGKPMIFEQHFM